MKKSLQVHFLLLGLMIAGCGLNSGELRAPLTGTAGLKNFNQVAAHFDISTKVSRTSDISAAITSTKTLLAKSGQAKELNPQMQLAFINVAGAYCRRLVDLDNNISDNDSGGRRAHAGIQMNGAAVPEFDLASQERLINRYTELFWRRGPSKEEKEHLLEAIAELKTSVAPNQMSNLLLSLCSIVAGSIESLKI